MRVQKQSYCLFRAVLVLLILVVPALTFAGKKPNQTSSNSDPLPPTPSSWDSVRTYCGLKLAVNDDGNFGGQGMAGQTMGYSASIGEWRPDYDTYLYDGGQVIGWIDETSGDTVVNWGLLPAGTNSPTAFIPQGGALHSSNDWADIYFSGLYTTNDGSIAMSSKWFANYNNGTYECFIIKETRLYSLTGPKPGLMFGEIVDWDIPGDSALTNNSSGYLSVFGYDAIYQQGIEIPGFDDSLEFADGGWDNDERFGAVLYLNAISILGNDTTILNYHPHSLYSADNATNMYPYANNLYGPQVYEHMSVPGATISDSIHDLHSGICYLFDYDLADGETLIFFTAYATTMNSYVPASGLEGILQNAAEFYEYRESYIIPCCPIPGDVNSDGQTNISDLTYTVDFMFNNGPSAGCEGSADVNKDCSINIIDLTYRVDYMFRGGASLLCGCGYGK